MIVRPAVDRDLQELARIERSAARIFVGTHMAWAATSATLPSSILASALAHGLLLVADVGEIVGFIAGSSQLDCIYVEELSVAFERQRRGVGRALLSALVDRARALDLRAVGLITDRTLPWNRTFYETVGFVDVAGEIGERWLYGRLQLDASRLGDSANRCAMILHLSASKSRTT